MAGGPISEGAAVAAGDYLVDVAQVPGDPPDAGVSERVENLGLVGRLGLEPRTDGL